MAALVLMPFGMSAATASGGHVQGALASSEHCDNEGGQPGEKPGDSLPGCTAGCSMFIAGPVAGHKPDSVPRHISVQPPAKRWTNVSPETATPPPKQG